MKNKTAEIFKGIKASLPNWQSVVELYVDAREADEYFYWSASSEKSVQNLKDQFPNLMKIYIEDDYLVQTQIDALIAQFPPIEIE